MTPETIGVRGSQIELLRAGGGPPLLYLHSAGGNVWIPFLETLAKDFTVIAPSHPGFGPSQGLERIDSIHDLVFHTIDLMDGLGLDKPVVVGLSLGGWLAAEIAVHHPERVAKLGLISAVGLWVEGAPIADLFLASPPEARRLLFHEPESALALTVIPDDPSPEVLTEVLKSREASARIGWNPYFCDPKLAERLYRVKAPTLVVWGDDDRLVPPAHGAAYARGIRDAKLVTIERCGHAPPLERARETAAAILAFLDR